MLQSFALALAAGMVATVNPCGFALLPAYLSAFLGIDDEKSRTGAVGRAITVSSMLALGFITVFGLFGLVLQSVFEAVADYIGFLTIGIGGLLIALGAYLVSGRELMLNTPRFDRGGTDGTLVSMYLFGISYAVASLSCTFAVFVGATATASTNENFFTGLGTFVMFGLGMGLVVAIVTVAVALAKSSIVNRFRQMLPHINRVAGGLLLVAGVYVIFYGWFEIEVQYLGRSDVDSPIVDFGLDLQNRVSALFPDRDNVWQWALTIVVVLGAINLLQYWANRTGRAGQRSQLPTTAPIVAGMVALVAVGSLFAPFAWARSAGSVVSADAFGLNWTTLTVVGLGVVTVWAFVDRGVALLSAAAVSGLLFVLLGVFNLTDGLPMAHDLIAAGADRSTVAAGWGPGVLLAAGLVIAALATGALAAVPAARAGATSPEAEPQLAGGHPGNASR